MSIRTFRAAAGIVNALSLLTVVFLFSIVTEVGSAYVMSVHGMAAGLPLGTTEVALPLLRISPTDPHNRPVTRWWVWCVWIGLMTIPALATGWLWRTDDLSAACARFTLGATALLILLFGLSTTVAVFLALPFACL